MGYLENITALSIRDNLPVNAWAACATVFITLTPADGRVICIDALIPHWSYGAIGEHQQIATIGGVVNRYPTTGAATTG